MTTRVSQVPFPPESRLSPTLAQAHYHDAFAAEMADPSLSPVQIITRFQAAFPNWGEALLAVRNGVMKRLGVRDVGAFRRVTSTTGETASVGAALGIFTVRSSDEAELVLGIDDTHLDVRISVLKRGDARRATCVIGSVVTTHNALGRLYMLPVAPFHRAIVRSMMGRAGV